MGGNATPRGARRGARAAGRAGADFPLRVLPVPTSAVLGPVDEVDGPRARRADMCRGRVGESLSLFSWPCFLLDVPGLPRAARAGARLSHWPGSARVGRGGGRAGRRESAAGGRTSARLGPAAGDPEALAARGAPSAL